MEEIKQNASIINKKMTYTINIISVIKIINLINKN